MATPTRRSPTRFTSESVTEGHPDKLADQISDAILDSILAKDPLARVACETTVTTGLVLVAGEITTDCYVDIPRIIRETVREAGYTRAKYGFDSETCGILLSIDDQSPDIAHGVDIGGAGDSGVTIGYACDQTPELMPLPIALAHRASRRLAEARRTRELPYLRPDGKVQVTVGYEPDGTARAVESVVLSAQHHDEVDLDQVREELLSRILVPAMDGGPGLDEAGVHINPTGRFVVGGPVADVGATGRKVEIDSYGGWARHGGGAFSGKDPTKIDRCGSYGARYVAKTVVAAGLATECEVQLAYAIGMVKPVALHVHTFGTGTVSDHVLERTISRVFDLSPLGIIKELNLRRPLFRPIACYGHFGRADLDLPWEATPRAAELRGEVAHA